MQFLPLARVASSAMTRRAALSRASGWAALSAFSALASPSPAAAATLPSATSLADELARAVAQRQPLVVMVSLDGCPFCKVARDHYLAPLQAQQGLPVVQVDMRSPRNVLDFKGQPQTHDALSRAWQIRIAPTVLFFGRGGREVAERLVGGYLPDFYGAYLEERLAQARASLR